MKPEDQTAHASFLVFRLTHNAMLNPPLCSSGNADGYSLRRGSPHGRLKSVSHTAFMKLCRVAILAGTFAAFLEAANAVEAGTPSQQRPDWQLQEARFSRI